MCWHVAPSSAIREFVVYYGLLEFTVRFTVRFTEGLWKVLLRVYYSFL